MSDGFHVVVKGENLSIIAKKYKVTVGTLTRLNPVLRKNINVIYPGMLIRISDKIQPADARISRMIFDGKKLSIYSVNNDRVIASYTAISGLPANAPHLKELIGEGRKDLDSSTDYTFPKYQNVKDAGPIQEDNYTLILKANMPYDKSQSAGDGAGWGEGGWILTEHFMAKVGNLFGGRFGFFLHHDGGNRGTSGCIGLKMAEDMKQLKNMLIKAQAQGQKSVLIEVVYQ